MKKRTLLATLALALALTVQAQVERNVVYQCVRGNLAYTEPVQKKESTAKTVGKILGNVLQAAAGTNTSTTDHPEYADAVKDAIMGAVGSARRVNVIDGSFDQTANEVAMYCDATISSITCTTRIVTWEDENKKKHERTDYRGNIVGTFTLKDAGNNQIVLTRTINSSSWVSSWADSPDKAIGYAIDGMKDYIRTTLNNALPIYANIVEGSRATEKKSKEVYINVGENFGCYNGMHFDVYTVKTVAGKEAKKRVGQLRITETMGSDISLCKVQRGGAEIKTAIDAGEALLITSQD